MAVIKQQHAAPLLKEAIVLDLGDVGRQAARIMAAAQDKAGRLVSEAEAKAKKLIESAEQHGHEKGYQLGYEEGLAAGTQQGLEQGHNEAYTQANDKLQQIQDTWRTALASWEQQHIDFTTQASESILELALRLTEKLVHRVVEVDSSVVVDQVGAALAHVMGDTQVVIRICPQDRAAVDENLPELMAEFSHLTHAKVVDDPQISPGGCIVTYGQGRVDGTLETQLARAVDLILPQVEESDTSLPAENPEQPDA